DVAHLGNYIPTYWQKSAEPNDKPDQLMSEEMDRYILSDYSPPSGMVRPHFNGQRPHGFIGEEIDNIFELDAENAMMDNALMANMPHKAPLKMTPYPSPDASMITPHQNGASMKVGPFSLSSKPQMHTMKREGMFNSYMGAAPTPFNTHISQFTRPNTGRFEFGTEINTDEDSSYDYLHTKLKPDPYVLGNKGMWEGVKNDDSYEPYYQKSTSTDSYMSIFLRGLSEIFSSKTHVESPFHEHQLNPSNRSLHVKFGNAENFLPHIPATPGYVQTNETRNLPTRDNLNYRSEHNWRGVDHDRTTYYGHWT
ncbi:MAG: hypothetical protein KDH96_07340, partial [Candidatus Riesia sp.]|nr:hypothetical protein [Candidatus Riesia sp.]